MKPRAIGARGPAGGPETRSRKSKHNRLQKSARAFLATHSAVEMELREEAEVLEEEVGCRLACFRAPSARPRPPVGK